VKTKISRTAILLPLLLIIACASQKIDLSIPLEANQFASDYSSDIKNNDKLFKGKTITVSGEVFQSYTNKSKERIIVLMQKDKTYGVKCILSPSAKPLERPLKQGELIEIKGVCMGFDDNVILTNSIVLIN